MVLVCGDPSEAVTASLCARLTILKIDHRVLDLRVSPDQFHLEWGWHNGQAHGSISQADWRLDFDDLSGVYFRNVTQAGSVGQVEGLEAIAASYPRTNPQIAAVLNNLSCNVANRPVATYSNRSKPYQALIIRRLGFRIPKTLITNDPEAARTFYSECEGRVIFKSISGIRSVVRLMNRQDFERLSLLENCPTQFQEYLGGDNIRVHVIGERLFTVRIKCDAVDYRYAGAEGYAPTMVSTAIPENVATNCIRLAKELGLSMAGIDLKETPEGEYCCFEVNTSPAFPFYESPARPVISDALAEFLAQREA